MLTKINWKCRFIEESGGRDIGKVNYYGLNPCELKIEVDRINDVTSNFDRGSHVKVTHIPTGEWAQMYGTIKVSQSKLLEDCLFELRDILKYPSKRKKNNEKLN